MLPSSPHDTLSLILLKVKRPWENLKVNSFAFYLFHTSAATAKRHRNQQAPGQHLDTRRRAGHDVPKPVNGSVK